MIEFGKYRQACCDLIADVVRAQGTVHLKVAGSSMVPTLWPGDLVTVGRCEPSELQTGSLIVFRQDERLIVHRLMHWEGGCVVARGDASSRFDRPAPASDVIGRVESILRDGRIVATRLSFWQSMTGMLLRRSQRAAQLYMRVVDKARRFQVPEAA
jgi:signal peptidase